MTHRIIVVGIGPGDSSYLLPKAQNYIENARILVGGRRALADYSNGRAKECSIGADIPSVLEFIRTSLSEDDVVVMVSGDPGYYSLLDALRRTFPIDRIEVVPGISSLQLAFARLALPWHGARLLSFHGREPLPAELTYAPAAVLGTVEVLEPGAPVYSVVSATDHASIALHMVLGFTQVARGPELAGITFEGGMGVLLRHPA